MSLKETLRLQSTLGLGSDVATVTYRVSFTSPFPGYEKATHDRNPTSPTHELFLKRFIRMTIILLDGREDSLTVNTPESLNAVEPKLVRTNPDNWSKLLMQSTS